MMGKEKDGHLHKKQAIVEDLRTVLGELEDREWGRGVGEDWEWEEPGSASQTHDLSRHSGPRA